MAPWSRRVYRRTGAERRDKAGAPPGPGGRTLTGLGASRSPTQGAKQPGFRPMLSARRRGSSDRVHAKLDAALQVDGRLEDDDRVARHADALARLAQQAAG